MPTDSCLPLFKGTQDPVMELNTGLGFNTVRCIVIEDACNMLKYGAWTT